MPVNIVSSVFAARLQKDGRSNVVETHVDLVSISHQIGYVSAIGDDLDVNLAAHAQALSDDLAAMEVSNNLNNAMTLGKFANGINTTIYSTNAQNVAALQAAWPTMLAVPAIFVGEYLSTLSDAVLQAVFGWTAQKEQNVRTNFLTPYATIAASIRAATGTS